MKNNTNYCDKEILNVYLNQDLFHPDQYFEALVRQANNGGGWKIPLDTFSRQASGIELIIRPECNQKCEYCYIARYGNDLYPHSERVSREQILKNVKSIVEYVFNTKSYYAHHWELFAGDLFYDNIYFDILDIFYEYLEPLYNKYPQIFKCNEGLILTPTNFSFIDDDSKAAKVEEYIVKFSKINWELGFSISTDGKYAVDTREQREVDDLHFDKLFKWTLKYPRGGFHPILSASNIKNAIKNYEWWKENFKKYYSSEQNYDILPYWLEARNDEWTDQSIEDFIKLLDHMLEDRLVMCNNNIDELAYHLFCGDGKDGTIKGLHHFDLLSLRLVGGGRPDNDIQSCSLAGLVCINVANFALVPCHRLNYRQFRGGYFIVDDDNKIIDVEPYNIGGYLNMVLMPASSMPNCATCDYNTICHKGCIGSQYEASGEPFLTCRSVCKLMKKWYNHLIYRYTQMGILRSAYEQSLIPEELLFVIEKIKQNGEEVKYE